VRDNIANKDKARSPARSIADSNSIKKTARKAGIKKENKTNKIRDCRFKLDEKTARKAGIKKEDKTK
jgi:hypothetical protein